MSLASDWLARKTVIYEDLNALLAIGVPLATARRLAAWSPVYAYESFESMQDGTGTTTEGNRDLVKLLVTRSPARANADQLVGAVLDAGTLYAVFFNDVPELNITLVEYRLDGSAVQIEGSPPWDFAGTAFDGSANRATFVAGPHEIEAEITDSEGVFIVTASFSVE